MRNHSSYSTIYLCVFVIQSITAQLNSSFLIQNRSFQNQHSAVALVPHMLSMRNVTTEYRLSQYRRHQMLMSTSISVTAIVTYATKTSVGPRGPRQRHGKILWSKVDLLITIVIELGAAFRRNLGREFFLSKF